MTYIPPWIGAMALAARAILAGGAAPPAPPALLQETGFYILQETGFKILLEP